MPLGAPISLSRFSCMTLTLNGTLQEMRLAWPFPGGVDDIVNRTNYVIYWDLAMNTGFTADRCLGETQADIVRYCICNAGSAA